MSNSITFPLLAVLVLFATAATVANTQATYQVVNGYTETFCEGSPDLIASQLFPGQTCSPLQCGASLLPGLNVTEICADLPPAVEDLDGDYLVLTQFTAPGCQQPDFKLWLALKLGACIPDFSNPQSGGSLQVSCDQGSLTVLTCADPDCSVDCQPTTQEIPPDSGCTQTVTGSLMAQCIQSFASPSPFPSESPSLSTSPTAPPTLSPSATAPPMISPSVEATAPPTSPPSAPPTFSPTPLPTFSSSPSVTPFPSASPTEVAASPSATAMFSESPAASPSPSVEMVSPTPIMASPSPSPVEISPSPTAMFSESPAASPSPSIEAVSPSPMMASPSPSPVEISPSPESLPSMMPTSTSAPSPSVGCPLRLC